MHGLSLEGSELAAWDYTRRGWRVVPIPNRAKRPDLSNWQRLRLEESVLPRYFGVRPINVGVLLGEPSNWLIDIDLDHSLAVELADQFLRPTEATFGRRSKPRSHWLFYATRPVATRQWRIPGKRQMIAELRSTGSQTVFPGSIHTSGEPIQWYCDGEPTRVDPSVLIEELTALHLEVCQRLRVRASAPVDRPSGRTVPPSVVDRAAKYPPAVSGQGGHNATFYAACTLVIGFGLDRDSALGLLHRWNEACQPPWSEKELAHKVDEALKQPGWRGYLLARPFRRTQGQATSAIERANRHAIEHRRRARRMAQA